MCDLQQGFGIIRVILVRRLDNGGSYTPQFLDHGWWTAVHIPRNKIRYISLVLAVQRIYSLVLQILEPPLRPTIHSDGDPSCSHKEIHKSTTVNCCSSLAVAETSDGICRSTYLSARIEAARRASSIWDDSGRPPRTRFAHYPETGRADSNRSSRDRAPAPVACDPTRRVPSLEKSDVER